MDLKKIEKSRKVVVYGNVPYYITSPIIEKLIENASIVKRMYFVVQKEVGERIVAKPGSKAIGRLSMFAQYHTDPKLMFGLSKECFYPAPEIDSVFLSLEVRTNKQVDVGDEKLLFDVIKKAYNQRRKTILNSLSSVCADKKRLTKILESAKVASGERPENLDISDFARIVDGLNN